MVKIIEKPLTIETTSEAETQKNKKMTEALLILLFAGLLAIFKGFLIQRQGSEVAGEIAIIGFLGFLIVGVAIVLTAVFDVLPFFSLINTVLLSAVFIAVDNFLFFVLRHKTADWLRLWIYLSLSVVWVLVGGLASWDFFPSITPFWYLLAILLLTVSLFSFVRRNIFFYARIFQSDFDFWHWFAKENYSFKKDKTAIFADFEHLNTILKKRFKEKYFSDIFKFLFWQKSNSNTTTTIIALDLFYKFYNNKQYNLLLDGEIKRYFSIWQVLEPQGIFLMLAKECNNKPYFALFLLFLLENIKIVLNKDTYVLAEIRKKDNYLELEKTPLLLLSIENSIFKETSDVYIKLKQIIHQITDYKGEKH